MLSEAALERSAEFERLEENMELCVGQSAIETKHGANTQRLHDLKLHLLAQRLAFVFLFVVLITS